MSISEVLRRQAVSEVLNVKGVAACFPIWKNSYQSIAGVQPTAKSLVDSLGKNLGPVFKTTGSQGRAQKDLSGGGAAWEGLICWYLNLCLIGTRTVVVKKSVHLPSPVRDSLTLSYGATQTNTESDLVAVTFPDDPVLDSFNDSYRGIKKAELDQYISDAMGQIEVCVIQCKTNWNDNAQIPMLWDLVYSAKGFTISGVSIGRHGHSIHTLRRFAYAFVTLPSNDLAKYGPSKMPVLRLSRLSGGNYWGFDRRPGVAGAVSDIFARNFSSSIQTLGKPWLNHLNQELKSLNTTYSYFQY